MHHVYVLVCADNSPYTGCTNDLKERVKRHSDGHVPATKPRLPVRLVNYIALESRYKAFEFEKYLKSGSGRAFLKKHFM